MDVRLLEGIAQEAWEGSGSLLPVDPFVLAERLGFDLRPWPKSHGGRDGSTIWYPIPGAGKVHDVRAYGSVGHELGHALAEYHGLDPNDEEVARYLAGALVLPRVPFRLDAERVDLDLDELQALHPCASGQMIVCRMSQVLDATAWIWDSGKLAATYGIPADEDLVRELVDRVLRLEEPVREGPVRAWPRFDRHWRRVIVVRRAA